MPPQFSYEDTSAFLYIHNAMTLRRPPCQAVCPAGVPVSLMNRLMAQEKTAQALAVLLDITPFPEWMCKGCSRPCESACNKKRHGGAPVPIARLAELAASCLPDAAPPCARPSGCNVAVIGNTVMGLAAAYFLQRLGHAVTVMGPEENVATMPGQWALGRVRRYLAGRNVAFTAAAPSGQRLDAEFHAVIAGSAPLGMEKAKLFVVEEKTDNPPALIKAARLAACAADAALSGYAMDSLAWLRILPNKEVERELLPLNLPEDAKPVTTVRYEDLNNTAYFNEHLTFGNRLAPLASLAEQAMECFHCGKCIGCGTCVAVCPGDVLAMKDGQPCVRYPDECIHCSACMLDCPSGAIFFRLPLPATLGAPMKFLA